MSSSLEDRVARLERQNRILRTSLLLGVASLFTCGGVTSNFELVRTQQLVIVDGSEQPKISLSQGGEIILHDGPNSVTLDAARLRKLLEAPATP